MSCYDTLNFRCPICRQMVEVQSKAGACSMAEYGLNDAPLLIIADINDEGQRNKLYCQNCSTQLELEVRFVAVPRVKSEEGGKVENFRKV